MDAELRAFSVPASAQFFLCLKSALPPFMGPLCLRGDAVQNLGTDDAVSLQATIQLDVEAVSLYSPLSPLPPPTPAPPPLPHPWNSRQSQMVVGSLR